MTGALQARSTTGIRIWVEYPLVPKTILLLVAVSAMAWPSSAAPKRKVKGHSHVSSASHKSGKTASVRAKGAKSKTAASHRRSYQQAPTPERYKEIQQALSSKGYLHQEPTGQWDTESANALKKFQADQNLTPDGKLNSLSLIALGLGPRHTAGQNPAPPAGDVPKADLPR